MRRHKRQATPQEIARAREQNAQDLTDLDRAQRRAKEQEVYRRLARQRVNRDRPGRRRWLRYIDAQIAQIDRERGR